MSPVPGRGNRPVERQARAGDAGPEMIEALGTATRSGLRMENARVPPGTYNFAPIPCAQLPMTENASPKAWSGSFSEPVSDLVKRYTASVFFDNRMALQDIYGSLAHARMLARQGIITAQNLADVERGMN